MGKQPQFVGHLIDSERIVQEFGLDSLSEAELEKLADLVEAMKHQVPVLVDAVTSQ